MKMTNQRILAKFVVAAVCGWLVAPATETFAGGVFNMGNGAEPKDLDPQIVTGVPESHILQDLFEGLVGQDPKTLAPIPAVAESWKISKDNKTYTFILRKNAKWTNGDPVTAKDFVDAWTRLLTPVTAAEYAYQGYYMKNGKPFNEGKLKDASQLGFKAIDATTLEVKLENPTPFFLGLLAHHSLYPTHKATVEKFGPRWTRPENIVSNGAFSLEKWEMNKIITLKKSETYWDKAVVTLDKVNFHPVEKQDTEEKLFRSKGLQVTNELPLEKIPFWQADKTGVYQQSPYLGIYHYWINVNKVPTNNKLVRQALNLGFDRESIVKYVTRGGQNPALSFTPPGSGGFMPLARLPKDLSQLAKAKELLAKAGYPDGKGLPPIEILYNTSDSHKKIAEAMQQMWKKNLGVNVVLVNQEWKVYLDTQTSHNFTLSRAGWIGDYNDANTFLDMFMSDNGNNKAGFVNAKYDELLHSAEKEIDGQKRLKIFQAAEDILMEELPMIPIYVYTRVYLKSKGVKGWDANILDVHPRKYVSLVPSN